MIIKLQTLIFICSFLVSIQAQETPIELKDFFPRVEVFYAEKDDFNILLKYKKEILSLNESLEFQSDAKKVFSDPYSHYNYMAYDSRRRLLQVFKSSDHMDFSVGILHEYAHTLFESALRKHFKEDYEKISSEVLARGICTSFYDQNDESYESHIQNCEKKHPADLSQISLAFTEVFADFFTNIVLDSPEAMSEYLLRRTGLKDQRNFSINYKIKGWNSGPLYDGMMGYHHEALNPTRYALWQKLSGQEKKIGKREAQEKILQIMLKASLREIKKYRSQKISFYEWKTINQEYLNRALIQAIMDSNE